MKNDNIENAMTPNETDDMKKDVMPESADVKADKKQKSPKQTKAPKAVREKKEKKSKEKTVREPSKFTKWIKRKINLETRTALEGVTFCLPLIIGLAVFFLFPLVLSIMLSFSKLEQMVGYKMSFIGFKNFETILIESPLFMQNLTLTLQNTFIKIPFIIIFSLLLAIIISKKIKFKGFFRVVFFLPFILGTGNVLQQLQYMEVVDKAITLETSVFIPMAALNYLGTNFTTMVNEYLGIIVNVLWSCSVQILLFLSALQSISPSLYESAGVDGATEWEKFWKITLPMVMPQMVVNIIYSLADTFTAVDNPVVEYIKNMISANNHAEMAAASWIYTIIILIFVGLVFLILGRNYASDTTKGADLREIKKAKKRRYNW